MATGNTYNQSSGLKQSYLNLMKLVAKDKTPLSSKYFKKGTRAISRVHQFTVDKTVRPTAMADVIQIEGAAITAAAPADFTQNENYVQNLRIVKHISTVQQAVEYFGVDNYLSKVEEKALLQLAIDQEYSVINGVGASGASGTARQMRGLAHWGSASGNTATALASATETAVNDVLEAMLLDGTQADLLVCSTGNKRNIDVWTALGATRFLNVQEKEKVATINVYEGSFGRIELLMHSLCPDTAIYLVARDGVKMSFMTEPKITPLGRVSGGYAFEAEVNSTLEVNDPDAVGVVTVS